MVVIGQADVARTRSLQDKPLKDSSLVAAQKRSVSWDRASRLHLVSGMCGKQLHKWDDRIHSTPYVVELFPQGGAGAAVVGEVSECNDILP